LFEQIKKDSIESRKSRDVTKSSILGMVLSDLLNLTKSPGRNGKEISDGDVISVIKGWIKKLDDSMTMVMSCDGDILKMKTERLILIGYLPVQLSDEEITYRIEAIVSNLPEKHIKHMSRVMKALKEEADGQFDGKVAADLIKLSLGV